MKALIVESDTDLATVWQNHLNRQGIDTSVSDGEDSANILIRDRHFDVLIINVILLNGNAFVVADYASYRLPHARVIFVTSGGFFSDGSVFALASNACVFVQADTPIADLAAMVEHHAAAAISDSALRG